MAVEMPGHPRKAGRCRWLMQPASPAPSGPSRQTHSVMALDIFQTGVTFIRWQKWFTETSHTISVASK